ncbi:MAG: DUF5395 family protein [Deltaproteobacteria bacterium]|nr:DUF5395 family protein [Deltaproteobacteria bacterium]MBW2171292.1 DUF5395 family protein [Deltaproteobacteria bacterium]
MIELIVTHDGKHWIAKNDDLHVQAPTLVELDSKLKRLLKEKGYLKRGEKLEVFMACDRSIIPQWMHQYSHHYFNRIVEFKG